MQITADGFVTNKKGRTAITNYSALRAGIRPIQFLTDNELASIATGDVFVFDIECYPNFFYIAFKHLRSQKFVTFEKSPINEINWDKLNWMLWRYCIVGFNSKNYDLPMLTLAMTGVSTEDLKIASDYIIYKNQGSFAFEQIYHINVEKYNHIDLFDVAPLQGSLKLYAGRLHAERLQDLPIENTKYVTEEEAEILRAYCCNDLALTELLFNELAPEINLRLEMSKEYNLDLRSKSDAQVAEAVINSELSKVLGYWPKKPTLKEDSVLAYKVPSFIQYRRQELNSMLDIVRDARFYLDAYGAPIMPAEIDKLKVQIGKSVYKLGMGGLHSTEKVTVHKATNDLILSDFDVESYYPRIILNQRLYPPHLGDVFLDVYEKIVNTRVRAKTEAAKAKKAGDKETAKRNKTIADSLKITINGSFGKLGNKYSTLYAPQLLLQVTISGQLALLMLIEMLEDAGISVVSGNTDGVLTKYDKQRYDEVISIVRLWETKTSFKTEETRYSAVYSRDVNSYIAVKINGEDSQTRFLDEKLGIKTKGAFCERGSALNSVLSKNPETIICTDAVLQLIKNGIPIEQTIKDCKDIRRFLSVRNVKGGAVKNGTYLGKVVRWYYPLGERGQINYMSTGNKVPKTDGARPLMDLSSEFPADINYDWYIQESMNMLYECGYYEHPKAAKLF